MSTVDGAAETEMRDVNAAPAFDPDNPDVPLPEVRPERPHPSMCWLEKKKEEKTIARASMCTLSPPPSNHREKKVRDHCRPLRRVCVVGGGSGGIDAEKRHSPLALPYSLRSTEAGGFGVIGAVPSPRRHTLPDARHVSLSLAIYFSPHRGMRGEKTFGNNLRRARGFSDAARRGALFTPPTPSHVEKKEKQTQTKHHSPNILSFPPSPSRSSLSRSRERVSC